MRNDAESLERLKDLKDLDPLLCDNQVAQEYALFQFNNLATNIVGHAQLALNNPTYESLKRCAQVASECGQKVASIARSLLVFSNGSAGDTTHHNINEVLVQVAHLAEAKLRQVGVDVIAELDEVPPVRIQPTALREVFLNLLVKGPEAADSVSAERAVRIRTGKGEATVRVVVDYAGMRISRDFLERLCVPLFDASCVGAAPRPVALGQSLTDTIGGTSDVTVDVVYPDEVSSRLIIGIPFAPEKPSRKAARVLVVDDEPVILSIFSRFIKKAGHIVETASGGREAIEKILQNDYDVVLLDWMMPEMGGIDVLREATRLKPNLPFVVVTAAYGATVAAQAIEAGARECIGKPLNHKKVLYLIEKYSDTGAQHVGSGSEATTQAQGEVLLIAEPDSLTRDLYHLILDHAGYSNEIVSTYNEICERLEKEYFDAIMVGAALLEPDVAGRIRSVRKLNPYTPILIIGDHKDESLRRSTLGAGASAFLEKPLSIQQFLLDLRTILDLYKAPGTS